MVDLTKLDAAVMAQHLGKPDGEIGRALADAMAERNRPAYEAAIKRVGLLPGERLVEIGFGNGKLVPHLLALAPGATYTGVDFSEMMVAEAEAFNADLIEAGKARFHLASVERRCRSPTAPLIARWQSTRSISGPTPFARWLRSTAC